MTILAKPNTKLNRKQIELALRHYEDTVNKFDDDTVTEEYVCRVAKVLFKEIDKHIGKTELYEEMMDKYMVILDRFVEIRFADNG